MGKLSDKEFEKLWGGLVSDTPKETYIASGVDQDVKDVQQTAKQLGGGTVLGHILDFISRGEYASANVAKGYRDTGKINPNLAVKGLTGEDKTTYSELVDDSFPEWSKLKRFTVGFSLSMIADPTTYIPNRAIQKGFQLAGAGATKIPGAKKVLEAADKSAISKAFRPHAGLDKDYYEAKYYAQKGFESERHKIIDDIEELRSGLSKDEMEQLSFYREHPELAVDMPPKLQGKLDEIGQRFDSLIDEAETAGVVDAKTAQTWREREVPYMPHYYPERPGGIGIAKGEIPPTLFEKGKKPSFTKKRKFETLEDAKSVSGQFDDIAKAKTIEEAQEKIANYGLDDVFGRLGGLEFEQVKSYAKAQAKYYQPEENIIKALGFRRLEQSGFIARKKFVDDVLRDFGHKVRYDTKVVPEGYGLYFPKGNIRFFPKDAIDEKHIAKLYEKYGDVIPVDEIQNLVQQFPTITKRVQTYMLPKEIASDMNRMNKMFFGDAATSKLLRFFDKPQGLWKGMATAMRLPFHLRNMYSNWFQAYLSGVNPAKLPMRLSEAAAFQSGKLKKLKLGDKTWTYDELKNLTDSLGVHGRGWMGSDEQVGFAQELDSIIKYGKLRKLTPMQAGRKLGTTIEDNSRVAVFFDQLSKGKTPKEASQAVRKYMFDYQELTPFEKNVMRRAIPFYTWSRKNIPLQIQSLLTQPRKYQVYAKGQRAFSEDETEAELRLKPEYFNEMLYVKSPWTTDQGKPIYMSTDLPPQEFNRMLSVRHWVSSLTPWMLAAQLQFNYKTFPEMSQIQKFEGQKTQAPMWVPWLPKKILKGMKHSGIVDEIQVGGKKVLGMDKKWVHGIQTAFPFLNELNRIYAQPIELSDERPAMKWKAYVSGIGFTALDRAHSEKSKYYEKERAVRKVEQFSTQHLRYPSKEEQERLGFTQ